MRLISLGLLLLCSSVMAVGVDELDTYDPNSTFYYKAVLPNEANEKYEVATNISLFDTSTENTSFLIENNPDHFVIAFIFEVQKSAGEMEMVGSPKYLRNVHWKGSAEPYNKILYALYSARSNKVGIYAALKDGSEQNLLAVVPLHVKWHLDVRNRKLRFNIGGSTESVHW